MNKVNLKTKVVVLAIVLASAFSINLKAQDDYLITNDGEKIIVGHDVALGPDIVSFKDKNFKQQKYRQSHVKVLFYGGRVFIRPGKWYLEEIICYNDKYFLTGFLDPQKKIFSFYSIYDWSLNDISTKNRQDRGAFGNFGAGGTEKRMERFTKHVVPYFGDCKSVIDKMTANIKGDKLLCNEIYNEKCGTKYISEFIKSFLSGQK